MFANSKISRELTAHSHTHKLSSACTTFVAIKLKGSSCVARCMNDTLLTNVG